MHILAFFRRSFPTFWLLATPFQWIGRSRRRVWYVVLIPLAMVMLPPLWWVTQLIGLPDVGDPFEVEAFRAMTIPDDRNAFVLYRQATTQYRPLKFSDTSPSTPLDFNMRWSKALPEVRRWAESNRDALNVFRRGLIDPMHSTLPSRLRSEGMWSSMPFDHFCVWLCSRRHGWRKRVKWPELGDGIARPFAPSTMSDFTAGFTDEGLPKRGTPSFAID